jgi:hypothetical protein
VCIHLISWKDIIAKMYKNIIIYTQHGVSLVREDICVLIFQVESRGRRLCCRQGRSFCLAPTTTINKAVHAVPPSCWRAPTVARMRVDGIMLPGRSLLHSRRVYKAPRPATPTVHHPNSIAMASAACSSVHQNFTLTCWLVCSLLVIGTTAIRGLRIPAESGAGKCYIYLN